MLSISTAYRNYLYVNPAVDNCTKEELIRRRNQIKLLPWPSDGYAIWYQRLERGAYEQTVLDQSTSLV